MFFQANSHGVTIRCAMTIMCHGVPPWQPSGGPQHGNGQWRNCRGRQSRAGREWTGALAPVLGCIDATPRSARAPIRQMTRPVLGPKVFSPGDVKRFFYIYII